MIRLNSKDNTLLWLIHIFYVFLYVLYIFSLYNIHYLKLPDTARTNFHKSTLSRIAQHIVCYITKYDTSKVRSFDYCNIIIILHGILVLLIHFAISVTFYLTWNIGLFSLSLQTTETSPTTIVLVGKTNGLCQTRLGRNTRTRVLRISRKWKGMS